MNNSLKFWRDTKGLRQTELAKKIGVDQSMVSWFENGDREPSAELWELISAALSVPVDYFFAPPPIVFDDTKDAIVERISGVPSVPGEVGKSKKARRPQGFGRVNFLTPSQARVRIQRRQTIKLSDEEWDGVEVFVELPCESEPNAIRDAKIEAAKYCNDFLEEEIGSIMQNYLNQYNANKVGKIDGEESGISEDPQGSREELSGTAHASE